MAPKKQLRILHVATAVMGVMGITFGISMIGVKSLLDVWWKLSGIFAGGMLGIFLMGYLLLHKTLRFYRSYDSLKTMAQTFL